MPKSSFAEKINNYKTMLAGVKQNAERLARRGLDNNFITAFENNYNSSITLDNEQEKIKAELHTKTQQLDEMMNTLDKQYSEAKKIVKLDMEKSTWAEFGIQDKR